MSKQRGLPILMLLAVLAVAAAAPARAAGGPPQGTQSDAAFAASYAANAVTNVSATTQRVSCYTPEVAYLDGLTPAQGYIDGGGSPCNGATTGEDLGPYPTQNVASSPMRVKDHSESDLRVDPTNPYHVIGQSKWFVNGEGYNHLLGFYESFDATPTT